jgi:hypothetical protein
MGKSQIRISILIVELVIAALLTAAGVRVSFDLRISVLSITAATSLAGGVGWLEVIIAIGTALLDLVIIVENVLAMIIMMSLFAIPSAGNIINGILSAMTIVLILTLIPF